MTTGNTSTAPGPVAADGPLLEEEAAAFDRQIFERISNGHVPDLRRSGRCEYFYNNVWRDSVYADMFFGEIVRRVLDAVDRFLPRIGRRRRLLEIGSGPGHIALELARNGLDVTGIDLSPGCVRVAAETAAGDPFLARRGPLRYECGNVHEFTSEAGFDLVLFSGSLHHFRDLDAILGKVLTLLVEDGLVFASEPVREELTDADAAIVLGIRQSLALAGRYYEAAPTPATDDDWRAAIEKVKDEFAYRDAKGSKIQSPLDNESRHADMLPALKRHFAELESDFDCCFFDRVIGGLRFPTIAEEHEAARWIRGLDRFLCRSRAMTPELFHFIGRRS